MIKLKDLLTIFVTLGTFLCQQHGKQDEWERQMAEEALRAKVAQANLEYKDKVELIKELCPPLQQLGPNPSEQVLKIYQENCRVAQDFLAGPKPQEPKP